MGKFADALERLADQIVCEDAAAESIAEKMGYDAGINGPNTTNCHFSLFRRPELTKAWERGKARGDAARSRGDKETS